jgi:cyclic pyranopterin phosphate synthase
MAVNCLRISVTDRCNQRCVYCRSRADCDFIARTEILRGEEIQRLVQLFVECGVDRVRLTGGEPLVRRDVVALVAALAGTPGIREVALTTNGVLLEALAADLKRAGLDRVNVSLDALEARTYRAMTGGGDLPQVLRGIRRAVEVGLQPVKINAVILRHINAGQILALAALSLELPVIVRFIEYCPTSCRTEPADNYLPYPEIRAIVEKEFGRLHDTVLVPGNGPASYYRLGRSAGVVGFIAGRSTLFCSSCNRIRLTCDGRIKPCLYSARPHDVKTLLRQGASDDQIRESLRQIIAQKAGLNRLNAFVEDFSMRRVGG